MGGTHQKNKKFFFFQFPPLLHISQTEMPPPKRKGIPIKKPSIDPDLQDPPLPSLVASSAAEKQVSESSGIPTADTNKPSLAAKRPGENVSGVSGGKGKKRTVVVPADSMITVFRVKRKRDEERPEVIGQTLSFLCSLILLVVSFSWLFFSG